MKWMAIFLGGLVLIAVAVAAGRAQAELRLKSTEVNGAGTGSSRAAQQGGQGMKAAPGKLTDLAFLAGRWTGTAGTATTEEICMQPSHHVMTCMFRSMDAENTTGLEFITLRELPIDTSGGASVGTMIEERVRFYSPDLAEGQGDNGITLRLASVSGTEIVFNNAKTDGVVKQVKILRNGEDEFTSHIDLVGADGKPGVIEAKWKRGN